MLSGDSMFRQVIGIPMGTDCAPFLANLFLFAYEYKWLKERFDKKEFDVLKKFQLCFRFFDDLLCINNDQLMDDVMTNIYPLKSFRSQVMMLFYSLITWIWI